MTNDVVYAFENKIDILSRDILSSKDEILAKIRCLDDAPASKSDGDVEPTELSKAHASTLGENEWQERQKEVDDFANSIIVESLIFPAMAMREDTIAVTHTATFEWMLKKSSSGEWDNFMSWLRNDHGFY